MTYYYSRTTVLCCLFLLSFIFSSKINAQNFCQAVGGTISVTNTNDAGNGSLRGAIICANEVVGAQVIQFNIPGDGPHIIYVGASTGQPLPNLTDDGTVIDGSTQSGFLDDPLIVLDGSQTTWSGPYNALYVLGDYCEIYGLTIRYFPDDAIDLNNADHAKIGAAGKGNVIYSNGIYQDVFPGFSGFWNGCGIVVRSSSDSCSVQGNTIGTNFDQSMDAGNEYCGIIVRNFCLDLKIGGPNEGEANVIANNPTGIRIDNSYNISIRKNSMYCNDTIAIELLNNGNFEKMPPTIDVAQVDYISGTAPENDIVDVFVMDDEGCEGAPCQGKIYLGTAITSNNIWFLATNTSNYIIQPGDKITAIATTPEGTSSSFANCRTAISGFNCAEPDGTIWVTNTEDDGPGSLRIAINCANDEPGSNVIKFNIPDSISQHRIFVGAQTGQELPALLDEKTIIDATTQPGFGVLDFAPKIVLDGIENEWDVPINAIWVRGNHCEIYGLEIVNFPDDGIDVTHANFAIIGAPNKGNVIFNNGYETDFFSGLPNTGPWNGCGVVMRLGASFCTVQGNFIGTNYAQDSIAGNEYCGVIVQSNCQGNLIGGDGVGEGNVIAYNELAVRISNTSLFCQIQQNRMYCNEEGIKLLGNGNQFQPAPTVDSVSVNVLLGKGIPGDFIEVFINDTTSCASVDCQGKTFLGTVVVDVDSLWNLSAPYPSGENVYGGTIITATATDSMQNTSPFSNCLSVPITCNTFVIKIENVQNATCGLVNGSFEVMANGGFVPYVFDYGNGATNESVLDSLAAGIYYVTVTDNSGCVKMDSIEILEINAPVLTVIEVINENCGQANGSIILSVTGGTPPFLFDIGNGFQTDSVFINLTTGVYPIIFTDYTDCQDSIEITVENIDEPLLAVANVMNENCDMADGSFTVIPFGGNPPFQYDIGNGSIGNPNFTGLSNGFYTVVVTDDFGCSNSISVVIFDALPILGFAINIMDATCGLANGSFEVSVTNGLSPYSFDIGNGATSNNTFTNLAEGDYQVMITDFAGCTASINVTIGGANSPAFSIINIMEENCGQGDGSFEVFASGGMAPYTYDIGSGATSNPVFSNLNSTSYNIILTDANGCSSTQVFTLGENEITLNIDDITNATCGLENGSITVSTTGGIAPFIFNLGNGVTTNPVFENLAGGVYNITLTDSNGCSDVQSATVGSSSSISISFTDIQPETCGQMNGEFTVNATGGAAPYTFDIGNGVTNNNIFTNLSIGNYIVTVTDNNGCQEVDDITIEGANAPSLILGDAFNETCNQANGAISVIGSGGEIPYTYDFGNGPSSSNVAMNLSAGIYTVIISDNNGCTGDLEVVILNIGNPVNAGYTYNNNIYTVDFTNTSTDATSYSWDFGDGASSTEINPSHTYNSSGDFEVCLTVSNSCSNDLFCEIITITLPENIVFDLSDISGEAGDTVYLEVAVENFEDMILFQKSIHMMDTTVAQFIGVSNLNLIDLSTNNFTVSNNTITADWMTNSSAGQSVADGTIIYELAVKLLFKIDCSPVIIDDNPLPLSAVKNINGTNLNINVDVFGGEVCVTNGMGNTVKIAGLIFKENGQAVANVAVTCLTAPNPIYITNSSGAYEFLDLAQGGDYTVTPYKNDAPENGLSALDLVLIQQHILGTNLLNSPYKIIAADANNSSSISALDLVAIQNIILGNATSFPNNTSWRFVPEDYIFPNPMNPFSPSFPEEITLFSLGVDSLTENFIAIKTGDVNLNSTPSLNNDPTQNVVFLLDYQRVINDEYLLVDFKMKNNNQFGEELGQLFAWQMDLEFDPKQLIFEKIENTSLPDFNKNNVGIKFLENGILPLIWVNPKQGNEDEISLRDEVLFTLKFMVKNDLKLDGNIFSISKDRIKNVAFKSGQLIDVNIVLENDKSLKIETLKWKVNSNYPNPFNEFTTIKFHLPESENVIFSVFDMQGKLVYQLKGFFKKGANEIRVDKINLPTLGLYHYQLQTSKNQSSGKMILMK